MRNIHIILLSLIVAFLTPIAAQAQGVVLKTDTVSIPCTSSDTFLIPVRVLNFNNLGGLQFTLEWDKTQMQYVWIQDFNVLLENGFVNFDTTTHLNKGQLTFAWLDPNGLTIPNSGNNSLFKVAFVRLGGPFSPLRFDTTALPNPPPTAITVTNPSFQPVPFTLSFGGVQPIDATPPSIACPANQTLNGSGPTPVPGIAPTVNDNCGIANTGWKSSGATITNQPNNPNASNSLFNVGQSVVTYTTEDVGGNVAQCSFTVTIVNLGPPELTIIANGGVANCGQQYVMDVTVNNFEDIFGVQFSLGWELAALSFDSVSLFNPDINITSANFNLAFINSGQPAGDGNLSFGWNSDDFVNGSTLADGTLLFRVYFTVEGSANTNSSVDFVDFPAARLSIDANLNPEPTQYVPDLLTIIDVVAPTLTCPANQAVTAVVGETSAIVNGLAPLAFADNCSTPVLTYTPASAGNGNGIGVANGTYPGGTTTVIYTATDGAGNTSTCSFQVSVDIGDIFELKIDSVNYQCIGATNPTVSIPFKVFNFDDVAGMNFRVQWDPTVLQYTGFSGGFPGMGITGADFPSAALTSPTGLLNFLKVSSSGAWPNIPDGGIVFRLNFNILNTNATTGLTFSQPLNAVNGLLDPVPFDFIDGFFQSVDVSAPVVTCPANIVAPGTINCQATVTIPNATATDACGTLAGIVNNAPVGNLFNAGATQVTYTATDLAGNTGTCSMTVTVTANTSLQIPNCPTAPIVVQATGATCSAPISYPPITASNPCTVIDSFIYTYNFPVGVVRPVGTTTVVATATQIGNGGGFVSCNISIQIVDASKPVLTCPQNETFDADPGVCFAVAPNLSTPSVEDNCSSNLTATINPSTVDTLFVGPNVLVYTATDNAGNTGTCSYVVTVAEQEAPLIGCPDDIEVPTAVNSCSANVSWLLPTVSDNCSEASAITISGSAAPGELFDAGETTVTYTATDESGNQSECSFTVTVNESILPILSNCPNTVIISLPANECDTIVSWIAPTATDNCGVKSLISTIASGTSFSTGTTTVIYTVEDNAGNTATCSFLVIVKDQVPPTFLVFPNNISVNQADPCGAVLNIPEPIAQDNCDPNPLITYAGSLQDTFPVGTTTIEIRVTDASGNFLLDTLVITVNPIAPPFFTNIPPSQVIKGCFGIATWTPPTDPVFCTDPTVTSNFSSGATFPIGTTTVIYTATDANGGTVTATFNITVEEDEAPIIVCPAPVVVSAAGVVISDPSNIVGSIVPLPGCTSVTLVLDPLVVSDNCTDIPSVTQTSGPVINGGTFTGTNTMTFVATDESNNTSVCTYTVEVQAFNQISATASPIPGCPGAPVTLSVPVLAGATYNWSGPNGFASTAANPTVTVGGNYTAAISLNGCTTTTPPLDVVFVIQPDAINDVSYTIGIGETLDSINVLTNDIFSPANDFVLTQKSPLDGLTLGSDGLFSFTPTAQQTNMVSFIYEICSESCPNVCDMATVTINIRDKDCDFIPNIFTPNGDLTNDLLEIACIESGLYRENSMVIYNQWGDKVFEASPYSNDADKAWNGGLENDLGKPLPDGVYYYIFQPGPGSSVLKGFIQIFR